MLLGYVEERRARWKNPKPKTRNPDPNTREGNGKKGKSTSLVRTIQREIEKRKRQMGQEGAPGSPSLGRRALSSSSSAESQDSRHTTHERLKFFFTFYASPQAVAPQPPACVCVNMILGALDFLHLARSICTSWKNANGTVNNKSPETQTKKSQTRSLIIS